MNLFYLINQFAYYIYNGCTFSSNFYFLNSNYVIFSSNSLLPISAYNYFLIPNVTDELYNV